MPRRLILAAAVLVLGTAGFLSVVAASASRAGAATGASSSASDSMTAGAMADMSMPSARAAAAASKKPTRELHRRVVRVTIVNFAFKPSNLVVSKGTRIVWTNKDSDPHTVTSDHRAFHSEAIVPGGRYTLVARRAGRFTYHCQIHPYMHGILTVRG